MSYWPVDVYVCHVPLKITGQVLRALKSIPNQTAVNLHHLRRVVKREYWPEWLQQRHFKSLQTQTQCASADLHTESLPVPSARLVDDVETVHILLVPVSGISRVDLLKTLENHIPNLFSSKASDEDTLAFPAIEAPQRLDQIFVASVPLYPPISYADALNQSTTLWPTVYNPNTAYGPNPADVASAQLETEHNAGYYMALARKAALETKDYSRGEPIGVVIVESLKASQDCLDGATNDNNSDLTNSQIPQESIVCVAGDARYCTPIPSTNPIQTPNDPSLSPPNETNPPPPPKHNKQKGNPANHAIMRAIEMVAHKRCIALLHNDVATTSSTSPPLSSTCPPLSQTPPQNPTAPPYTPFEQYHLTSNPLKPNGYLCLNLHIFTTHEPCAMCSMALVHSRVGRVVFARRMRRTGGLCADMDVHSEDEAESHVAMEEEGEGEKRHMGGGLGYGLFWREELNWRFLCWQWRDGERAGGQLQQQGAEEEGAVDDCGKTRPSGDEEDVHDDVHA